jgi:hypothetical protein
MKKDIPVEELAPQLEKDKGNVAAVARRFGVSRGTILNRVNESPTLQKVLADARESMLDNAESVLYKKVLEGSTPELLFFLKTQGRKRGYIERIDHGGEGENGEIVIRVVYGNQRTNGQSTFTTPTTE